MSSVQPICMYNTFFAFVAEREKIDNYLFHCWVLETATV